jgi:asparagine synthase (glutamine-hydrolysing)
MSAFVCILDRSGAALDRDDLLRLTAPLDVYGGELASLCRGPVGIAIRHPPGPSSAERHGPLVDPESGRVVAVAGRFGLLDAGARPATSVEPAAFALQASARPIGDLLARVAGAFVLVVAEPAHATLSVVRDHLGAIKLYYYLDPRWLIAASEPAAILRHPAVSDELDQSAAARFLGFRFPPGDRSFFRRIRELPAGHRLHVTGGAARSERCWRLRRLRPERGRSREEVRADFLARLEQSVRLETAGLEPRRIALSLGGGLDSSALAALAPRGIRAFSWTFEETPPHDERPNVEALSQHLDLAVRWVQGDGHHPLCEGFTDRFVHPGSPYVNAFASIKAELYRAARAEGCTRVMVGDAGDVLYAAQEYWLRDVLLGARAGAVGSLVATLRAARQGSVPARAALRRLLPVELVGGVLGGGLLGGAARPRPRWLTPWARSLLPREGVSPIVPATPRRRRYELAAGARNAEIESEEQRLFARCGVERSNPFWFWPLLEMVLGLSADWSYRDGRTKVLSREAFTTLLPQRVVESPRVGLLGDLFLRGIDANRAWIRDEVLRRPRSDWRRYVDPGFLEPALSAGGAVRFEHTILWRVISYELWQRRLIAGG